MDPTQTLELAQALKLSPTLLQSMNILQMTTLELSAYLKDLALENPVLEEQEGGTSWEEFAHQVSWLADQPGPSGGEAVGEPGRIDQETGSLSFLLEEQLDRLKLDQKILAVCRYLVGLLDDRGWLDPADLEGLTAAGVPEALLEQAVKTLQSLDPAGIGARNLGECLTLQLDRLPGDAPVARAICAGHLDQLGREAYAAIARELGVSLPQVREAANVIRALDPAPGREEELSQPVEYVRPDAWVAVIDGELRVFTNQWDLPQFHLSDQYLQLAKGKPGDEATEYLRQKMQQARWVLQCVQRRQGTLQRCLEAMVQAQADYFWGRADAPPAPPAAGPGGPAGGPPLDGHPCPGPQVSPVPPGAVSHGLFLRPSHGRGGDLGPAGEGGAPAPDPSGRPEKAPQRPGPDRGPGRGGDALGPADRSQIPQGFGPAPGLPAEALRKKFPISP